ATTNRIPPFPRSASVSSPQTQVKGAYPDTFSQDVSFPADEKLRLAAGMWGVCYAIYRLNPGSDRPTEIKVTLENVPSEGVWIGVSDFSHHRWRFNAPSLATVTVPVDDVLFANDENIFAAVVLAPRLRAC